MPLPFRTNISTRLGRMERGFGGGRSITCRRSPMDPKAIWPIKCGRRLEHSASVTLVRCGGHSLAVRTALAKGLGGAGSFTGDTIQASPISGT